MLLNTTLSVEHLTPESGNSNLNDYVVDVGLLTVPANIQPQSPSQTDTYGGAYSSVYKGFIPITASGIVEADRVTDASTGTKYIIKGKNAFNYGLGQHIELLLDEVIR